MTTPHVDDIRPMGDGTYVEVTVTLEDGHVEHLSVPFHNEEGLNQAAIQKARQQRMECEKAGAA